MVLPPLDRPSPRLRPLKRTAALLLLLLFPAVGAARGWRGIDPGTATKADVLKAFGEPSRTLNIRGKEVVTYYAARAIRGTSQVQFQIDEGSGVVSRIDIFPSAKIDVTSAENTYGAACGEVKRPDSFCYVKKILPDGRTYLLYEKLAMALFLKPDGKTIYSLVFGVAKAETSKPAGDNTTVASSGSSTGTPSGGPAPDSATPLPEASMPAPETVAGFGAFDSGTPQDPLQIGGILYMLGGTAVSAGPHPFEGGASAPFLVDTYLDGRPNQHVRGMVLGRLTYDPTLQDRVNPFTGLLQSSGPNPRIDLDQLWLSFDAAEVVYFRIGRQHIKWGPSKFWTPTDMLVPPRTNPLAVFDTRLGTDMIKLHIPWQAAQANFYAIGFVDQAPVTGLPSAIPAATAPPLRFGVAARAETVVLGAEIGAEAVLQQTRKPRFGFDFSSALGPLDVYGELALRLDPDLPLWQPVAGVDPSAPYYQHFEPYVPQGPTAAGTVGLSWKYAYTQTRALEFGAEFFYNPSGYSNPAIIPFLIAQNAFQPFYAGQMYAAGYARFEGSGTFDAFTAAVTGIANLSDRSALLRMDLFTRILTDLSLELFLAVPVGTAGGEFRFGLDSGPLELSPTLTTPPLQQPVQLLQVGLGLRINV